MIFYFSELVRSARSTLVFASKLSEAWFRFAGDFGNSGGRVFESDPQEI